MFNLVGRIGKREHGIFLYLVKWVSAVQAITQSACGSSLLLSLSLAINVQMCALQPQDLRWEGWELAELSRYSVNTTCVNGEIREVYTWVSVSLLVCGQVCGSVCAGRRGWNVYA